MAQRNLKKELCRKIGGKLHESTRIAMAEELPYLKILFENREKAVQLSAAFDLNEKEIAFLLSTKPETKKVKTIFEKAQELKRSEMSARRRPLQAVDESLLRFDEKAPEEETESENEIKASEEKKQDEEIQKQTRLF